MSNPKNLLYAKTHEWAKQDGNIAYVGITDYAQDSLGDVVYVELPEQGTDVTAGDPVGSIESVKAVSDIYSPVSGTILHINERLEEEPELLNSSPWDAWIFAVEIRNTDELDELLDASEYQDFSKDGEE